jgi:hypothetical protein
LRIGSLTPFLGLALVTAAPSFAASAPLPKPVYDAMLQRANRDVGRAEGAAEKALAARASRAELRRAILAWASTESRLGKSFRSVRPPARAAAANALLARGEIAFGSELAAAATHLPRAPQAIAGYLQRKLGRASGAAMIDEALKKLKAAGYGAS